MIGRHQINLEMKAAIVNFISLLDNFTLPQKPSQLLIIVPSSRHADKVIPVSSGFPPGRDSRFPVEVP